MSGEIWNLINNETQNRQVKTSIKNPIRESKLPTPPYVYCLIFRKKDVREGDEGH